MALEYCKRYGEHMPFGHGCVERRRLSPGAAGKAALNGCLWLLNAPRRAKRLAAVTLVPLAFVVGRYEFVTRIILPAEARTAQQMARQMMASR